MKKLDAYIFLELAQLFVLSFCVLMGILVLEKVNFIANLATGSGITPREIGLLVFFISPAFVVVTAPLSVMLASLVVFSRMSADNEITAMRASGISFMRMLAPVALLSLFVCALSLWLSVEVVHRGNLLFDSQLVDYMGKKMASAFNERRFYDRFPDTVIYVHQKPAETNEMKGVFIYDSNDSEGPRYITARKGRLSTAGEKVVLALEDGMIYSGGVAGWRSIQYRQYEMVMGAPSKMPKFVKGERQMDLNELREVVADAPSPMPPQALAARAELYKRFSLPFACLILGLLGAPLGVQAQRGGARGGVGIGIMMIVLNYILLMLGESLGREGKLAAPLALWLPNIIMGALAVWLILRARHEMGPPSFVLWWDEVRKRTAIFFSRARH